QASAEGRGRGGARLATTLQEGVGRLCVPGRGGRGSGQEQEGPGGRVPRRRAHATGDDPRGPALTQAVLQEGRPGDRGQRLGDRGRGGGHDRRERGVREVARHEAARPCRRGGGGGRTATVYG